MICESALMTWHSKTLYVVQMLKAGLSTGTRLDGHSQMGGVFKLVRIVPATSWNSCLWELGTPEELIIVPHCLRLPTPDCPRLVESRRPPLSKMCLLILSNSTGRTSSFHHQNQATCQKHNSFCVTTGCLVCGVLYGYRRP